MDYSHRNCSGSGVPSGAQVTLVSPKRMAGHRTGHSVETGAANLKAIPQAQLQLSIVMRQAGKDSVLAGVADVVVAEVVRAVQGGV